jgi:hypothetical protein
MAEEKRIYVVNASRWPLHESTYRPGDVFESAAPEDVIAAEQGYLILAEVDNPLFTEDLARRVKAWQNAKVAAALAEKEEAAAKEKEPDATQTTSPHPPSEEWKKSIAAAEEERRKRVGEIMGVAISGPSSPASPQSVLRSAPAQHSDEDPEN